jgi:hypothetical protein
MPCALALLVAPGVAAAAAPPVSTFPIPGGRVASPQTQITFRGVPASQLGSIGVSGSRSGAHSGAILGDSDGQGGSFAPAAPFTPGEVVTVTTSLNVLGATNGTFRFTVATPAPQVPVRHWPTAGRVSGDVQQFRSRRDLTPAAVKVTKRSRGTAPGDIFVAPQFGPVQDGPMILDPYGTLIWFKSLPGDDSASDFRVQTYQGAPVLTWWQGYVSAGIGVGEDVINDSSYRQIAVVHASNGLAADLHEFQLTSRNTALITAYYPVYWDTSSLRGPKRQTVLDSVVQEIDIPTGLVLFQWDSLDHVSISDSYSGLPKFAGSPFDYFHVNSIDPDDDGNLIISGRNTWAAYKLSHQTGAVIWRLGGKHSTFKLAPGTYWAFQHDVRHRAQNDQFITIFDDDAGPPTIHSQSRGIKLVLDLKHKTAHQVASHLHSPSVTTNFEGNFQQLPNRDDFVGWGQAPYFTEYDRNGRELFDGQFVAATPSYRAYRLPWSGTPQSVPAVAAVGHGRTVTVYASWNGATHIRSWRVLGGPSATALSPIATATKRGFETAITTGTQPYVAVQPLDWSGRVMATSATIRGT